MLSVLSITAPRRVVEYFSTRTPVERATEEALLPADRVSLSPEARRQLRAVEAVERGQGEGAEAGAAAPEEGAAAAGGQVAGGAKLTTEQQRQVTELRQRDAHVRQHEAAHQAAGGELTGAATFSYQVGPDGRSYAVGGEVPLQSRAGRTPDETIAIARRVRAAALAPSDPSAADLAAAAAATQMELRASQQKRQGQPGARAAGPGEERAAGATPPTRPAPRADLERLIVRAPEAQPFL
ncbi:MAG: hypothetical protein IPO09_09485 [Anaeromyxobacter sp.]|nr:hypothetical protein [Anaeromyxobacter sp.]MBL0278655.1 hypothetical protein [Anaeromyxobacter sp.]